MRIRLSSDGHYPDKVVEVTEQEYLEILAVEGTKYLQDTEAGRAWIEDLLNRPDLLDIPTIVVYC